jgi:hypothetical protein
MNNEVAQLAHRDAKEDEERSAQSIEKPELQLPTPIVSDYPSPRAMTDSRPYIYDADQTATVNFPKFAQRLRQTGDVYRATGYGAGLLLCSGCGAIPPKEIKKASELASIIVDRIRVLVFKDGKPKGSRIPSADLQSMLTTELFLGEFQAVGQVVRQPFFLGEEWSITRPGYNDGGRGSRFFFVGEEPLVSRGTKAIDRFLDVMSFYSNADRTNAVAAALTVMLRNHWPGGKPIVIVTSTKSHGGKDTIVDFLSGSAPKASISYEKADWALQKAFIAAIKHDTSVAVINLENVRLADGDRQISSAFIERVITDREPLLYSPGVGEPVRRPNHFVFATTTNYGSVSEDLLNRGLPIHLSPVGDIEERSSAIGNPKYEFLPANRVHIEAELRGMIENWKRAGRPLAAEAKHPFTNWAQVVGGILRVNGLTDFLGNYRARRAIVEPTRKALGLLGAFMPEQWLTASQWVPLVAHLGLIAAVISKADRESTESRARGLGIVLTAHQNESFLADTENEILTLRLEKARRRFESSKPETRYRFVVLHRTAQPEDRAPE